MIEAPFLSEEDKCLAILKAEQDARRRHAVVLHEKGDYVNRVFNVVCRESYMRPHCHRGADRAETMICVDGAFLVYVFDDQGLITSRRLISSQSDQDRVLVAADTWHTYAVVSPVAVIYEELNGVYDPSSWKEFAQWAPEEGARAGQKLINNLLMDV